MISMKKFRDENEIKYSLEKDFPVPERLSPESMETSLKGDNKLSMTGRSTATLSKSKKNSDNEIYARGPGLWTIGAAAAAIAVIAGGMFFFGGSGSDLDTQPSGAPALEEQLIAKEKDEERSDMIISVEGYDKSGANNDEIQVDSLKNGDQLTVKMKLSEWYTETAAANYWVFLNGYVALDPDKLEDGEDCLQFFNYMGNGEYTITEEGILAEYTFTIDGISDKALPDNYFSVSVFSTVDYYYPDAYPDVAVDKTSIRIIYNTAYEKIGEIDYLEELYKDVSPELTIREKCRNPYDTMITDAGYYVEGSPEYSGLYGTRIFKAKDGRDPYAVFYRGVPENPKYLLERAYFLFMLVDDPKTGCPVFTPLNVTPEDSEEEILIYNPMLTSYDTDGNRRHFFYQFDADTPAAELITVPAIPHYDQFGSHMGEALYD